MKDLHDRFEDADDEFLKFDRIENPRHPRPDLCAFLMLHDLDPQKGDMVGDAQHDEIMLNFDCDKLADVPDSFIVDLHRCGVRYDAEYDTLALFV